MGTYVFSDTGHNKMGVTFYQPFSCVMLSKSTRNCVNNIGRNITNVVLVEGLFIVASGVIDLVRGRSLTFKKLC